MKLNKLQIEALASSIYKNVLAEHTAEYTKLVENKIAELVSLAAKIKVPENCLGFVLQIEEQSVEFRRDSMKFYPRKFDVQHLIRSKKNVTLESIKNAIVLATIESNDLKTITFNVTKLFI